MSLFALEEKDELRVPWMFKLSNDSIFSMQRQTNSYTWFQITRFPRTNLWLMVVLNVAVLVMIDVLCVVLALPIVANVFTWWLLLPPLVVTPFIGLNTVKLINFLKGKGGNGW